MCKKYFAVLQCMLGLLIALAFIPVLAEGTIIDKTAIDRTASLYLPPYCKPKLGYGTQAEKEHWGRILDADGGKNYVHLHHYCYALHYSNTAMTAKDVKERTWWLVKAISNFDYVINRWSDGCILLPEAHLKKGQVLQRNGRSEESLAEFQRAIQLKPDYSLAYAAASDWYKENGQNAKAKEMLELGLKNAPSSKSLRKRLARLDN